MDTHETTGLPINPGITHVLYHGNCYDGFTAAWIAKNAGVPEGNIIPCDYGTAPEHPGDDAKVLMTDFSLKRPGLQMMEKAVDTMIVLDHHKTAEAEFHGLDWAYFDMEESGASLTWDFFHPEEPRPKFVKYIREHDLWRFELAKSAQVRAFIRSYEMTYENWDYLNTTLEMDFEIVEREGAAIQRAQEAAVAAMCKQARMGKLGGYEVPIVNATIFFSEVATRLLKLYPNAEFAAYYMDRADAVRQWGMRSRSGFDCSKVARRYGGGGHAGAAGFTSSVPDETVEVTVVDIDAEDEEKA